MPSEAIKGFCLFCRPTNSIYYRTSLNINNNFMSTWKQTTAAIYKAVLFFTIGGIASSIFNFFASIGDTASAISSLTGNGGGGLNIWNILSIVATLAILYGYYLFLTSLKSFKGLVNTADAPKIQSISTSTILMIVGAVLSVIPLLGWVGGIVNLIAWILLLLAYNFLKSSQTFPAIARNGMSKLFLAMILDIVGWILDFIPIVGDALEAILSIIAFFLILKGWKCVAESEDPETAA